MAYIYRHVKVSKVIDGDTVSLDIDLGAKITWSDNFRLRGIDTPEKGKEGYHEATSWLERLLNAQISRVETFKPDKYGRWLVDIYIVADKGGELLVNKLMELEGHAKPYFGGKK